MEREVLDIEISKEGEVKVWVKGIKGPRCLDARELFREFLGPIKATATTDEYYEKESRIRIAPFVKAAKR